MIKEISICSLLSIPIISKLLVLEEPAWKSVADLGSSVALLIAIPMFLKALKEQRVAAMKVIKEQQETCASEMANQRGDFKEVLRQQRQDNHDLLKEVVDKFVGNKPKVVT